MMVGLRCICHYGCYLYQKYLPMLDPEIKDYLKRSVLCWLATSSSDNIPNVSPKEAFMPYQDEFIIIANIASPQSVKNIRENSQVCLSFVDVFAQKGYQLKGEAEIINHTNPEYRGMKVALEKLTNGKFPFSSITKISIRTYKRIIAPSYLMYPRTTEKDQIQDAKKSYKIRTFISEEEDQIK